MRKSLLTSLALGCGALLGLMSFGASANVIHVGLKDAGVPNNLQSWTSPVIGDPHGTLSLSGWEYDSNGWTGATMSYKSGTAEETGLGVNCNSSPGGNECRQHEIGATPWQMIDMNISQLVDWQKLTIYLGSVNAAGTGGDETGYLLGATCTVGGTCTPITLASCTGFGNWTGHTGQCKFTFTEAYLLRLRISDIWVASSMTDQSGTNNSNILLGGTVDLYVPEPKALGIFGLGLLLIGAFVGLRRRERQTANT